MASGCQSTGSGPPRRQAITPASVLPNISVGTQPKISVASFAASAGKGAPAEMIIRGRFAAVSGARPPRRVSCAGTRYDHRGAIQLRHQRFPCDVKFRMEWPARYNRPHDSKCHSKDVLMRNRADDWYFSEFRAPHLLEHGRFALE